MPPAASNTSTTTCLEASNRAGVSPTILPPPQNRSTAILDDIDYCSSYALRSIKDKFNASILSEANTTNTSTNATQVKAEVLSKPVTVKSAFLSTGVGASPQSERQASYLKLACFLNGYDAFNSDSKDVDNESSLLASLRSPKCVSTTTNTSNTAISTVELNNESLNANSIATITNEDSIVVNGGDGKVDQCVEEVAEDISVRVQLVIAEKKEAGEEAANKIANDFTAEKKPEINNTEEKPTTTTTTTTVFSEVEEAKEVLVSLLFF